MNSVKTLSWSATLPTEPGHWWHRRAPGAFEHIVFVVEQLDHSLAVEERGRERDFYNAVAEYGGQWLRAVPFAVPGPPPSAPDTAAPALFKVGDILRYGEGATALMEVEAISVSHGGSSARYYGRQFFGGAVAAYHGQVKPSTDDEQQRFRAASPRGRESGSRPGGDS